MKPFDPVKIPRPRKSLLVQERGLKPGRGQVMGSGRYVAPCTGAWIETGFIAYDVAVDGRSLYRSVD